MVTSMMANLKMEIVKVKELTLGLIKVTTKASGWLIKWMEREFMQIQKLNYRVILKMIILFVLSNEVMINLWFYHLLSLRSRKSHGQRCRKVACDSNRLYYLWFTDEVDESWEPHHSETISINASDKPSVHEEFFEASIHVMEVELLVWRRARVNDTSLYCINYTLS